MNILLFGNGGQLGTGLSYLLQPLGKVAALSQADLDLTDLSALEQTILSQKPDLIINAAAYTAVDKAESEPELVHLINAEAPGVMAQAASKVSASMIHYSTDYVFDGIADEPYTEDMTPAPNSVYGETKLAGEKRVQEATDDYLIFRTAWVYSLFGQNFLNTMLRLAKERDQLSIVDDQIGCPTWAGMLAHMTTRVVEQFSETGKVPNGKAGIYHLVCRGETSWYGFARRIMELAGNNRVTLDPISTEQYPTPAKRPPYSVLAVDKFERAFGRHIPDWECSLNACLYETLLAGRL